MMSLNVNVCNLPILVNSCDSYSDIWEIFFSSLRGNFSAHKSYFLLNTETKKFTFDGLDIRTFKSSDNVFWGRRLLDRLSAIDSEIIIMTFDDFLIEYELDISRLQFALDMMNEKKYIDAIYLSKLENELLDIKPDFQTAQFVPVKVGVTYSLNSRPALWRKSALIRYTGNNDTPWAWEFFGSFRMRKETSYAMAVNPNHSDIYSYNSRLGGALHRGKWVRSVIEPYINRYNLDIDLSVRGCEDETIRNFGPTLSQRFDFWLLGYKMIGGRVFLAFLSRIFFKFSAIFLRKY